AAAAVVIGSTKLNQQAVIATDDLPRVYRGKSRSHRVVGVPERALLTDHRKGTKTWGRGSNCTANLRHQACGSQHKNAGWPRLSRVKRKSRRTKLRKYGGETVMDR